jgi:hypothetical protein
MEWRNESGNKEWGSASLLHPDNPLQPSIAKGPMLSALRVGGGNVSTKIHLRHSMAITRSVLIRIFKRTWVCFSRDRENEDDKDDLRVVKSTRLFFPHLSSPAPLSPSTPY